MPRCRGRCLAWICFVAILAPTSAAHAASDIWDNNPGGNWENGANWMDGSAPGVNDSATFNLAQTYMVTVGTDPGVIQSVLVSAGTVTLRSAGGAKTLQLTAGAGGQDLVLSGATTSLTLGTAGNPLHVTAGDDLTILNGAMLSIGFGSNVVANDLSGSGLNGTVRVDGAGSLLTLGGSVNNLIGSTTDGALIFQNGSTGNSITGSLQIAGSSTPGITGSLTVSGGSTLALGGSLLVAGQNFSGQTGSVTINGNNSALALSTGSTTVGSPANGTGSMSIGTTTSGGTFSSGTGLLTINNTGTVTIGSGTNTGTLHVGGDLMINGGVLQKSNAASTLDFAAGKTITIQAGGRLTIAGAHPADSNRIYNIAGANSKLEITGNNPLTIAGGAQVHLAGGAKLSAGARIDVGTGGASSGTLTVAGDGSTVDGGSELSVWGSAGGTANVELSDAASGTFSAGIDFANSAAAGTTSVVNILSGAELNTGSLNLAAAGGTTTAATLNVNGVDSQVTQAGAATLTVGHASQGTAAINVGTTNDGGGLTTGSGLFRINKTGTVTIGSGASGGTLEVLGNITVDGGVLQEKSDASTFAWTTGKTMTIQNGGRVQFASAYVTAASAQHIVSGAGSTFEIVGGLNIRGASQVGVTAGGALLAGQFNVGGGGTAGSLIIDGAATTATGGDGGSHWGSGGAASVTISNGASATLGGSLELAESAQALANVTSGAELTVGDLSLATLGANASATLNVSGLGSTVTLSPSSELVVGHATTGSATLGLLDGGTLSVGSGGATTLHATGTINVAAGTADLGILSIVGGSIHVTGGKLTFTSLSVNGGAINFNSGRIEQSANLVANDSLLTTLLGPTHELASGRTLAASNGIATISTKLDLNGGRLEGNSLTVSNTVPVATLLRIRNGGAAQIVGGATLAAGTTVVVEDGSALVAGGQITQASELQLSGSGRVAGSSLSNSGLITGSGRIDANLSNNVTGQIRLAAGERLLLRGGSHQNNGFIDVDGGELEVATGPFVNGTANPATATIAARNAALRFTAGVTNAGSIVCSEGSCNFFGNVTNAANMPTTGHIVITANSQATFFDDVVNRGTIQVSAAGAVTSTALFLGSLSGSGVSGNGSVFLEGDVAPGASVGTMAFGGDVSIGSAAVVRMELGSGSFDRLTTLGSLALGGTLDVTLSAGFKPTFGQTFDLFDWGTRSGVFAAIDLPAIPGLAWSTTQLYSTGEIRVISTLAGDFNNNGVVDAADYTTWRDGLGPIYTQSDYAVWKSHFGQTAGGSSELTGSLGSGAVPEPTSELLLLVAAAILGIATRRWGKS
jgi:fibronectin-binding autotransporter adhesin